MPTDLGDLLRSARVFAIPLTSRFRGIEVREGVLLDGPAGWSEFAPFRDYDDAACLPWLHAAIDSASRRLAGPGARPDPGELHRAGARPAVAAALVRHRGAGRRSSRSPTPEPGLDADVARVAAVREALGPAGRIRVDANGAWSVDEAVVALTELSAAADGLEYAEQPCATIAELAEVRRRDRRADRRRRVHPAGRRPGEGRAGRRGRHRRAQGGPARRCVRRAAGRAACGLPVVVSSAIDTSVGLAAGLALAGALPELPYACGLATAALLSGDPTTRPGTPVGGSLPVPLYAPAPTPDLLHRWAADAPTTRYWLDRLHRVADLLG